MTSKRKTAQKYSIILVLFLISANTQLIGQLDIGVNIDKARTEIFEDKNQEAIERLNRVIRLKPDQYQAYFSEVLLNLD
ncbi:MAG: hypothetical protein HC831_07640 [Chloroflexia bacterium]|nr:hypothetical protein [Chloroflexia bacterium]